MRSGRGKCPQCKEMIVVDLDAPELRCPFCHALLKKSAKSVAQVRAEQAAKEAEAAALAAKEQEAAALAAKEAEVAAQAAQAQVPEPVADTPVQPAPVEESVSQETQEAPAEEVTETLATQEASAEDEIGLSDEELAMMDEAPASEESAEDAATESAAEDEIGLSDEELAMMDEAPLTDEAPASETPVADDEPLVYGSIDAVTEEEGIPEEEDAALEDPAEEEALINNNVDLTDDEPALADETIPVVTDEVPVAEAEADVPADVTEDATEQVADDATEEVAEQEAVEPSVEQKEEQGPDAEKAVPSQEEEPAGEVEAQEETVALADDPAAEEVAVEEEEIPETISQEGEEPAQEVAADQAEEESGYTEEDMAFAASLSETGRTGKGAYVAPTAKPDSTAKKAERDYEKVASKGEKTMESIYKKPIAIIMMLLSIVAGAIWFLYYKVLTFGLISVDLMTTIANKLPTFGGDKFYSYVITAFWGVVAVVALLGLTGKKGKLGFLFILLAAAVKLVTEGGLIRIDAIDKIVFEHGDYVTYALCGLLLLAAVFFAVALVSGKDDYEFSGAGAILPILYMVVVVVGYIALILLPKFVSSFTVSANLLNYSVLGAIGAALLLTLVGVHSATASRSVNGWAIFATLLTLVLVNLTPIVVGKITEASKVVLDLQETVPYFLTPIIAIFSVIGFTASDLRN